jgi:hypothetical protein
LQGQAVRRMYPWMSRGTPDGWGGLSRAGRTVPSMIPPARALAACLAALAAASGCTTEEPAKPGEQASRAPAIASATASGAARALDTADAEQAVLGRDYTQVLDLPIQVGGDSVGVLALADDGVLTQAQSTVGLRGRDGFAALPQPDRTGSVRHAVYGDTRGPYSAWTETTSTSLDEFDWRVYLHDATTGRTRLLGDSEAVGERLPPAPGETVPAIGSTHVYWATTVPRPGTAGRYDVQIMAAPIDGSGPMKSVVSGGVFPQADGDALVYAAWGATDPELPAGRYEVRRHRDGATRVLVEGDLPDDGNIGGLSARRGALAYTVRGNQTTESTLTLIDTVGARTDIALHHDGFAIPLRLTGRFLAWGSGSANGDPGQYVLDLRDRGLLKLGEAAGESYVHADAAGRWLAWRVPSGQPGERGGNLTRIVRWLG